MTKHFLRGMATVNYWADIAYALGYASQQHFITDFRTVLGETPVQYKANLFS